MNSLKRYLLLVLGWLGLSVLSGCAVSPTNESYNISRELVYAQHGGQDLLADVYIPTGAGPFPGVIVIHGGGWYKGAKEDMTDIAKTLVANGFTAASISYRFAPEHVFPAQIHDSKAAVRWLRRNAEQFKVDPARIGAFGYSAGAHLAMLLGVTTAADGLEEPKADLSISSQVQAVVAGGTPADLLAFNENETMKDFLGGSKAAMPEVYQQASPIIYVSTGDAPTFLYHGRFDWVVDVEQSRQLNAALQAAQVPVEYSEATLGHVATFLFNQDEVMNGVNFLRRWLQTN